MKKKYDDDDGRVIANMNVEGMRWYRPKASDKPNNQMSMEELTKDERRGLYLGTMRAVALIAFVFVCVFFLLILGLILLWN
ncbi:MAG: hypothetical protein E7467_01490 [Ruminococcaceae bacterium]|nr:hypothetical protein [Oscillospiraceae bacterium]